MAGLGAFELLAVLLAFGAAPLPVGLPPLPPDPMVSRAAPDECLYFSSWNGTAEANPKSENLTERLLAEPEVQEFGEQLGKQIFKALNTAAQQDPRTQVLADAAPALLKVLATRPGALYVAKVVPTPPNVVINAALLVCAGKEEPALREAVGQLEALLVGALGDAAHIEQATIAGVKLKRLAPAPDAPVFLWGFKDSNFMLAIGEDEAKALLERLQQEHSTPGWLKTASEKLSSDRPAGVNYLNLAGILETAAPLLTDPSTKMALDTLGVSQLKHLISTHGLSGRGTVFRTLVSLSGEPRGLLKLIPAKALETGDLQVVPREATFATLVRYNLHQAYRDGLALAAAFDPKGIEQFEASLEQVQQQIGLKLEDDLLKPLGDRWTLYSSPEQGGGMWTLSGLVATVTLADRDRFVATHDRVLSLVQAQLAGRPLPEAKIRQTTIAGTKVYTLQVNVPFPAAPSWAITKDRLIVTLNREMMKSILLRPSHFQSLAEADGMREAILRKPSLLSYQDTAAMVTSLYPLAQVLGPIINGGLGQQGIDFQLPTLPLLSSVRPHLTPTIGTLARSETGFMFEQTGSLAINLDAATVGMATAASLGGWLTPTGGVQGRALQRNAAQ